MKNLTKIDKKSTRRGKNSHDEGQEGQDGHQEGKKRAKNENLRLRPDFNRTSDTQCLAMLALPGGVRGG